MSPVFCVRHKPSIEVGFYTKFRRIYLAELGLENLKEWILFKEYRILFWSIDYSISFGWYTLKGLVWFCVWRSREDCLI